MQHLNVVQLLVIFSLICTTSATFAADSPYLIDKRTFKKTIKTLALAPAEASKTLAMPENIGYMLETEVANRLERMGYELIAVDNYRNIRDRMERQVGGYAVTGSEALDADKMAAVREHAFREMLFRHDMDALVTIQVRHIGAPFENNKANWDGVDQKISTKTGGIGELFGKGKYSGTTGASSLQISIYDRSDELLFSARGGIEVVMQLDGQSLAALPTEQLFLDEKRLLKSVRLALKEL
ncbi:MAG: hypothetical protein O7F71_18485 [Gammaproteobacteria bacterium]|nr:hypothetical protein [Gammaproteobacteria bacterium]